MSGTSQTPRASSLTIPKGFFFLKYIFLCKYILVKPQAASQFCFQRALMKRLASPGSGGGERLSRAMCRGCRQHPGRMRPRRESSLPLILREPGWDFPPHPSLLGVRAQKTPIFCSPGLGFTPHITVANPQNSSWGSFINMIFFSWLDREANCQTRPKAPMRFSRWVSFSSQLLPFHRLRVEAISRHGRRRSPPDRPGGF